MTSYLNDIYSGEVTGSHADMGVVWRRAYLHNTMTNDHFYSYHALMIFTVTGVVMNIIKQSLNRQVCG